MGLLGCLVPGRKKRRPSPRHVDIASLKFSTLSLKNTGSSTVRVYLNGQGPVLTSNGKYSCVELPPYQLTGPLEWEAHVEIGGGATCFASGSLPDDPRRSTLALAPARPTDAVLSSLKVLVRAQVTYRQRTLRRKAEAKLIRQAAAGDIQVATRFWLGRKTMVCAVSHATALPPSAALRGRV